MADRAVAAFLGALSRLLSVPGPRGTGFLCRAVAWAWCFLKIPPWARVRRDLAALGASRASGESPGPTGDIPVWPAWNPRLLNGLVRRVVEHHLKVVVETFTMGRLSRANVAELVPVTGRENLERVLQRGRGAVLLIAHYGNWEVMGAALAYHGFPIHSFFMDQRIPGFEEFLRRIREGAGIGLVDRDDLKKALRILRGNALLGVVADQDGGPGGVPVRFLGRPASAPRGPAALARMSGAGVVPTVIRRTGDWRFALEFLPEIETGEFRGLGKEAFDETLTALFCRHYERLILGDPTQWLWFYDRFKPRRHVPGSVERMPAWPLALYNALQIPALAILFPFLAPAAWKRGDLPKRFGEYLGFHSWQKRPVPPGCPAPCRCATLLAHGVSVGEVKVLEPLLAELRQRAMTSGRDLRILVTTTCPDGIEMAEKLLLSNGLADGAAYFPLDLPGSVRRFLARTAPDAVVISETDLWPNFLYALKAARIPAVLYNGRISEGVARTYGFLRSMSRAILTAFSAVFVQTRRDWERLVFMAADPGKVVVSGNAKFDAPAAAPLDPGLERWARGESRKGPVIVWGSTHPADEEILAAVVASTDPRLSGTRHIVAPRKAVRSSEVVAALSRAGSRACTLSSPDPMAGVMVIDRVGVLAGAYALGSAAWVGGGYEPEGVHSIIEPLLAGLPVAYGPNRRNFQDAAEEVEALGFGLMVPGGAKACPPCLAGGERNPDTPAGIEAVARLAGGSGDSQRAGIAAFVESRRGCVSRQADAVWAALFPSELGGAPERKGGDSSR